MPAINLSKFIRNTGLALICTTATGKWYVECDGFLICWCKDEADAKRTVDSLLD
jgi:hypothetical protein